MFGKLIESQRRAERSARTLAASVCAHAAVIGLAGYATLDARAHESPPTVEQHIIYTPVAPAVDPPGAPRSPVVRACVDCAQFVYHAPIVNLAPVALPPGPPIEQPPLFGGPDVPGGPITPKPGSGSADLDGFSASPDEPARALPGNPRPTYPALLRSARVTGVVGARFVIDTVGRVEPASIAFDAGSDRLFEESVRQALIASRFVPAATRGRRVRMLVRQDFAFRLTP